ncbi:glucokinase [Marinihelvus fidelis]|uniref:Glucokinase n=1 Tax=Marinihelvus fidelis TaxID=2613842 RepID=A0A5N0T680_9GAMM|nr:glucokinase [Marinihelvus fidelis]KAA9130463.1 glucokinase [Marinihelvus fidelis]
MTDCLLVGDLGGTNARFALADSTQAGFSHCRTLAAVDFETPIDAMQAYLDGLGDARPAGVVMAVAGPIVDGRVRFSNSHWSLDEASIRAAFDGAAVRLMNDFEAIACSLPLLGPDDYEAIGPVKCALEGASDLTVGVLGPGTGLGVASLVVRDGRSYPLAGEGGHVGFAPESAVQMEVLAFLRQRFERVSIERLLCGPGIENIYDAMRHINGLSPHPTDAAEVFTKALENQDESASETVQMFFEVLGQAAGDLAMTLGAAGGIFIAGGIVKRYPELLKSSSFRAGFENKGRHRSLVERIPTALLTHSQPGLLGASNMAHQLVPMPGGAAT